MSKLRIAVTGSTGFIGKRVVAYFQAQGHTIHRLLRPSSKTIPAPNDIKWNVINQTIELDKLEGVDVIIHLAGVSLSDKRWTESFKREILESRVQGTTFLSAAIHKLKKPPKIFLSTSAIGFYGSHHQVEPLYESTPHGEDFLARVCQEWEQATKGAEMSAVRVIHMRFGAVIGEDGGALSKMLPIFKMGVGGVLGSGQQMFSWIAVDEIPRIMEHLILKATQVRGAVNVVAPHPVSNKEFTLTLGKIIKRPTPFPVPAIAVRAMFGEMADAILLSSANVIPRKLHETGYHFKYDNIETALKEVLK